MTTPLLFEPLTLRGITLRNRVVIAPMWQYRAESGAMSDWHLMHLGRFAEGGAGLVFQEGTTISRNARGTLFDLGIWDDSFLPDMRRMTRLIEACGSVPAIQLMHPGHKARSEPPFKGRKPLPQCLPDEEWNAWRPLSPSGLPYHDSGEPPREMTLADIQEVIDAFAAAARRARLAGYKVVEIHAAHGYLLHTFLSPKTNQRSDHYGGSFENRIRLTCEVTKAVRAEWPDELPLFVRLSVIDGFGWEIADSVALTKILMGLGVDVIDCSSAGLAGPPMSVEGRVPDYAYQMPLSAAVKRETGVQTMAVGLIVHPSDAEAALQSGEADLIAIAREALYNPNWAADAAHKLGHPDPHIGFGPRNAFWLDGRARTKPDLVPSTYSPRKS